jgi:hypothetical protein
MIYQDRLGTNASKTLKTKRVALLHFTQVQTVRETSFFVECFPYVCPEPVLAKRSFIYIYKWLKKAVFCRERCV